MIFVTGATGLLGSHLVSRLLGTHEKVRALRRPGSDFRLLQKVISRNHAHPDQMFNQIEWVTGDILDYYSLEAALEKVHTVYHCAAIVSFEGSDNGRMLQNNILGTANMVNAALHMGVDAFCYVSSIAALGRATNGTKVTERTIWKNSDRNTVYAQSKHEAEKEVWRGIAEGLKAVIVNPSIILGAGNWDNGSAAIIRTVDNGLRFYTKGINGFVDVKDLTEVMILLVQKKLFGERFIVSAADVSYQKLFEWVAAGLNVEGPKIYANQVMSKIAWRLFVLRKLISGKQALITRETAKTAHSKHHYPTDKLISHTGFNFKPLQQSINEITAIYREENQ
ncbi:MAG: NAD-dependent epimerase/dehydratase family protein [Bacteroidales bacterium]|jgi:nucleoside-diphosphate-sugar epimerase|nr:NAD-dependent epimerase/dehydratase family protein [Bacteroidales bacterium]HOI31413.1 NAD-dependent epimerase/dehydratase family protein [Bacteroidales bacterium]